MDNSYFYVYYGCIVKNTINENKIIKKKYAHGIGGNVLDATYFYYETTPNYCKALAIVCGGRQQYI